MFVTLTPTIITGGSVSGGCQITWGLIYLRGGEVGDWSTTPRAPQELHEFVSADRKQLATLEAPDGVPVLHLMPENRERVR